MNPSKHTTGSGHGRRVRNSRARNPRLLWLFLPLGFLFAAPALVSAQDLTVAEKLFNQGQYAACLEIATQAVDKGIWNENWRHLKIRVEMITGRYAAAKATLEEALRRYPSSLALHWFGHRIYLMNDLVAESEKSLATINTIAQRSSWSYSDPADRIALGRFFLHQGADPSRVIELFYDRVIKERPTFAESYIASGELAIDKHDYALAAESLEKAIKLTEDDPRVHYLLAEAYWSSDQTRAAKELEAALTLNPRHMESLLLSVDRLIDAERFDLAHTNLDQVLAINFGEPRAWAYSAVLAHLQGDSDGEKHFRETALVAWPTNPEVDHLIGRKLSQAYRFAEGAAYQRQALNFDGNYLPAKMQLCQDLLRLGDEEEGWRLAEEVFSNDQYSIVAHNLLTLQDHIDKFRTLESDGLIVRMDAREAEIYGSQVIELLTEARETLCAKYDVQLSKPTTVEIFPEQKDFAIRTFGLPGGVGFLGVCFGHVITANSPASQGESPSNWRSVLWHEFCHVVTLEKTNNKMPRWLSEGISVYEERQKNLTWGQSMNPRYRQMILGDELTPVSQLSGAFLKPPSPIHLQFAYFESSLAVEFLIEEYSLETLKQILIDLGVGVSINDALSRSVGSLHNLDQRFAEFARNKARALAPKADWELPDLADDADTATVAEWNAKHPNNFWGLQRLAIQLIAEKKLQEAKKPLSQLHQLYPEQTGPQGCLALLALIHRRLNETEPERAVLKELAALEADAVDVYLRLLEVYAEEEEWDAVVRYGRQTLAVNPLLPGPHRQMARASEELGLRDEAIHSYRALLQMDPIDPAQTHFRLASLLEEKGEYESARRQVLQALEEAPRFRAAHKLLLKLHARDKRE